jgi:hypothetical protein
MKILLCKHYFSPLNAVMRKEIDSDTDTLLGLKCGSGRTKTYGSYRSGSGSGTLDVNNNKPQRTNLELKKCVNKILNKIK